MISLLLILFIPGVLNKFLIICGDDIVMNYRSADSKYYYALFIPIPANTNTMLLKFTSDATIVVRNETQPTKLSIRKLAKPENSYGFIFTDVKDKLNLYILVEHTSETIPYVESILRDYEEICENPKIGFLDTIFGIIDRSCGRRKVGHTQLIVHGQPTKPGDWPWHVAIMRLENTSRRYICGGTLLSTSVILTAAHCASIRGNAVVPDILSVHLAKHNLIGGDIGAQEREVFRVIIHPKFDVLTLDNDIALLKLKSEVVITDYVQPACLWSDKAKTKLPDEQSIFGTVVGWGFNHKDSLSSSLQKITIPIVPELICLKSNPTFFHKKLNDNKICAGFANGTAVCNGDSGGGLMIFVPDSLGGNEMSSGGWYVRGIVSIAPSRTDGAICDPYEYTIFTDVEKYREWLLEYL